MNIEINVNVLRNLSCFLYGMVREFQKSVSVSLNNLIFMLVLHLEGGCSANIFLPP
jgi:hypothetical protein